MAKKKATNKRSSTAKKHKRLSLNAILWTIVITVIAIYALSNLKTIKTTLSKLSNTSNSESTTINYGEKKDDSTLESPSQDPNTDKTKQTPQTPPQPDEAKKEDNTDTEKEKQEEQKNTQNTTIYLVEIQSDGTPAVVATQVPIEKTTAILTQTLKRLLAEPSTNPNSQLKNFIPKESKLLSTSVKNRIAFVNFNEGFLFNPGGRSAATAQIFQLIYTCTEFSTIDKVQILINGKKVLYLSGEGGISVEEPLSREMLN